MYIISQTRHSSDKEQCIVSDTWSPDNGQPYDITYRSPSIIDLFVTCHSWLHNKPKGEVYSGHKLTGPKEEEKEEEEEFRVCGSVRLQILNKTTN
jgi:hypothetical protein